MNISAAVPFRNDKINWNQQSMAIKFNYIIMSFESMNNNNPNEQPLQEMEDINVDASFELPEEISEEMESSINEIPETEKWDSDELSDEEKLEVINTKGEEVGKKITDKMGLELKEDIGEIEDQIKDFRDSL